MGDVNKEDAWDGFVTWVRNRPPVIQELMREFPLCLVRTRPGIVLLIPAPGVEGEVNSYFEDGTLGVVAPTTIPHPEYGFGKDPETGELLGAGSGAALDDQRGPEAMKLKGRSSCVPLEL